MKGWPLRLTSTGRCRVNDEAQKTRDVVRRQVITISHARYTSGVGVSALHDPRFGLGEGGRKKPRGSRDFSVYSTSDQCSLSARVSFLLYLN